MKKRLDILLIEKEIYPSREKAKQAIEMERVKVDGKIVTKPAFECDENAVLQGLPFEFVSRGGFKLQKALEVFGVDLNGKVVLDIGASTGGFTDVCLQAGAKKVYSVDTGEGQLVQKIKENPKVVNMEKTNYLTLPKSAVADVDFVCIDVSFVSLTKLAPKLAKDFGSGNATFYGVCDALYGSDGSNAAFYDSKTKNTNTSASCGGNSTLCDSEKSIEIQESEKQNDKHIEIIALIKPQFEVGLDYARKHKGIVKDEKMHEKVVKNVTKVFEYFGFQKIGVTTSPILGGDGNKEFLIYLTK